MSRTGRPPKPDHERRTQVLRVRLTVDEIDGLYRAAFRRGITLSDFVREFVWAQKDAPAPSGPTLGASK